MEQIKGNVFNTMGENEIEVNVLGYERGHGRNQTCISRHHCFIVQKASQA